MADAKSKPDKTIDIPACRAQAIYAMKIQTFTYALALAALIVAAGPLPAREIIPDGACSLGKIAVGEPYRLSFAGDRKAVILDRALAQIVCVDLDTGEEQWRIDGSESGEAFIDPAFLSRSDGFYFYLTDYGSRAVWRVDVEGEIRGRVELSMASDPLFLELGRGGNFVLYDRADGTVHLLDDSARPLWSFDAGVGGQAGEPLDLACSQSGDTIYLLRKGKSGLIVSVIDIYGNRAREIKVDAESENEVQSARVEEISAPNSDIPVSLALLINNAELYVLDIHGQKIETVTPGNDSIQDIFSGGKCLYILTGNPPAIERFRFERDN